MKKIGLLLLAVVMLGFGAAGCSNDDDADPVGTWTFILDEGCVAGPDGSFVAHIFENETFIIDGGANGTYSMNGDDITMNLSAGYFVFTGRVDGAGMNGNFVGAASGCFTATRTSTSP